jgi:hypothetical protein
MAIRRIRATDPTIPSSFVNFVRFCSKIFGTEGNEGNEDFRSEGKIVVPVIGRHDNTPITFL